MLALAALGEVVVRGAGERIVVQGSGEVRGLGDDARLVSSSSSTSTSSPISTPAARRLAMLRPSRWRPRRMATRLFQECR
ncbi:hypothetical protein [Streptomyces showdoensis]|uniref:hypothetical protein n=1 Tax=Streptomyces showdoensis TaxID=68268 RepID=UPI0031EC0BB5